MTVSGFIRQNHRNLLPMALCNLIVSFYSLLIKKRLSNEQLQKLNELERGEIMNIPLFRFRFKDAKMHAVLQARRYNFGGLRLDFMIEIPDEVHYIAGYFAADYNTNCACRRWRAFWRPRTSFKRWDYTVSSLEECKELFVIGFVDIDQIKWKDEIQRDFDIIRMHPLTESGRHHLSINEADLHALRSDRIILKTKEGWEFWIKTFPWGHRHYGKGVQLRGKPSFLPLDVSRLEYEWTVRHQVTGKRYKKKVENMDYRSVVNANLKVDDLENETKIEIDIEYQIKKMFSRKLV